MKKILIENVEKVYFSLRRGNIRALKGIDLEIAPGSFFVLLGPSGCGKSTLLNIIAGIEKNSGGEIRIGEQVVASAQQKKFLSPKQRDIAMVFQSYALYPHMTVFENIAFPLKIARMAKNEVNERVQKAADILEIGHLLLAKPAELSGGQRQRVALGRAIVREPNVLLLDEPLSNLDALLRISMRSELKQIQRRLQVTTVYVTHDQTEAMSLGDKIAVLKEGEVQQVGTPDEIYRQPENMFVARFIGAPPMNLLEGEIVQQAKQKIDIPAPADEIMLGVRPEHIKLSESGGFFTAKLDMIGSLGSQNIVYLSVNHHKILADIPGEVLFQEGQEVDIAFEPAHLYIFNKKDGRRLPAQT